MLRAERKAGGLDITKVLVKWATGAGLDGFVELSGDVKSLNRRGRRGRRRVREENQRLIQASGLRYV
jgi:hypothetical protein